MSYCSTRAPYWDWSTPMLLLEKEIFDLGDERYPLDLILELQARGYADEVDEAECSPIPIPEDDDEPVEEEAV